MCDQYHDNSTTGYSANDSSLNDGVIGSSQQVPLKTKKHTGVVDGRADVAEGYLLRSSVLYRFPW